MNDNDRCICDSRPSPPIPRRCHRETAPGKAFCASCQRRDCAHHQGIGHAPPPSDQDVRAALVDYLGKWTPLSVLHMDALSDAILADPLLGRLLRGGR